MKKQLFLTAMAALVMVSCSEENVLDTNKGNAIDFRAAMGTRASETTTASMSQIYVTALTVIFSRICCSRNNQIVILPLNLLIIGREMEAT